MLRNRYTLGETLNNTIIISVIIVESRYKKRMENG
uniref:Uncharacterized protein n=1 Tax=Tetranychus urticae TaxID=32264 RepID=T1K764_TETUR